MRALAAVERFFERLFERPSARLFHAPLEPVHVLRRVERSMETHRRATSDGTLVPDRFTVRVHPGDLAAMGDGGSALAADLADGSLRFARTHGYRLRSRPRIDLVPDPAVPVGDVKVDGRFEDTAAATRDRPAVGSPDGPEDATSGPIDDTWDRTMVYRPPAVVGPMARLRVLDANGADRIVVVDGHGLTIGRDLSNDLVLSDARASRRHARLLVRQGTLVLVDLGSANGTVVNGLAVAEMAVGLGDEIRIGDTRLLVEGVPAG